jgi:hypothetical protein
MEDLDAPISTGTSPDGMLEVESVLPVGIKVGSGPYGRCLLATQFFGKGEHLYRGYAALVKTPAPTATTATSSTTTVEEAMSAMSLTGAIAAAPSKLLETLPTASGVAEDDSVGPLTDSSASTTHQVHSNNSKNSEFLLHLKTKDGTLVESFLLDDLNSVQDLVNPNENRRQVYGLYVLLSYV